MKLLLFIPAIMLMFSNVPFINKMSIEEQGDDQEMHTCCMNNQGMEATCHKAQSEDNSSKGSCDDKEDGCICILCCLVSAPNQLLLNYSFVFHKSNPVFNLYKNLNWKNPFISIPWQPPDLV